MSNINPRTCTHAHARIDFRILVITYNPKKYLYLLRASINPFTDANTQINDAHFRFLSTGMGWYLVFQ